jgi:hypothetical protein
MGKASAASVRQKNPIDTVSPKFLLTDTISADAGHLVGSENPYAPVSA